MEVRLLEPRDVASVLARLCEPHREEYARAGYPGADFGRRLAAYLDRADTKVALHFNDKPQAFFAIAPGGESTWLGLTDECMSAGIAPIRIFRRFMREQAEKYGRVWALVGSSHPQVVKWMQTIGFTFEGELPEGMKIFLYR